MISLQNLSSIPDCPECPHKKYCGLTKQSLADGLTGKKNARYNGVIYVAESCIIATGKRKIFVFR